MATMISAISALNSGQAIKRLLAVVVEHAGGDFVGIQGAQSEYGLPGDVLFNHPKHGSTDACSPARSELWHGRDSQSSRRVCQEI